MSSQVLPIVIFCAFLISLIIVAFLRKIYYFVRYRNRFFVIPRVDIRGISNIAMVIAISVAVIILLTVATADLMSVVFRAWPGTRMTIEGILIKIGGILFGPFLGFFIGGMTDLLTVALTAGAFHYGYLVSAMAFGLISGLISDIFKSIRSSGWSRALMGSIMLTASIAILFLFFKLQIGSGTQIEYSISIFGQTFVINIYLIFYILIGFISFSILLIWGLFLYFGWYKKKKILNYQKSDWFNGIILVLVVSIICNVLVNIVMMPSFDEQLSSIGYKEWLIIRSIIFAPEVVFNFLIILPIYRIILSKVDYDYRDYLLEDIKYPIISD